MKMCMCLDPFIKVVDNVSEEMQSSGLVFRKEGQEGGIGKEPKKSFGGGDGCICCLDSGDGLIGRTYVKYLISSIFNMALSLLPAN